MVPLKDSEIILYITRNQWEQMKNLADLGVPLEVCGLLGGKNNRVISVQPVDNCLHSPVRYLMDARDQFNAFQKFEKMDLDLVGIYHSHPHGAPDPSPTDIDEAYYPEVVYLIWSRYSGQWSCRGYKIIIKKTTEVALVITDS